MKILAAVRSVPDPGSRLTLTAEGQLDCSTIRYMIDPSDAIALDIAHRFRAEKTVTEIVAVTIALEGKEGIGEETLRSALARAADRAILCIVDSIEDPVSVASYLADIARSEAPDLILMGSQGSDSKDSQIGPRLAGILDWPVAASITTFAVSAGEAHLIRETDTWQEFLVALLPAVITCDPRGRGPRPAPLPEILRASGKPLNRVVADRNAREVDCRVVRYSAVPTRSSCWIFTDLDELLQAIGVVDALAAVTGPGATDDPLSTGKRYIGQEAEADALAWIAGKRGWPLISGVMGTEKHDDEWLYHRSVHRSRFRETVSVPENREHIIMLARGARTEEQRRQVAELIAAESPRLAVHVRNEPLKEGWPDMGVARVVVAGGRGLKDAANFERLVGGLAKALGGAMAASGGAVNAGIAPAHLLIGQTGRSVAPELYIALGISGVDQHVAGFQDAETVVAVNTDAKAPIFSFADFGLVADLNQVVPEWIAEASR